MSGSVNVVGAGLVGLASALALQNAGFDVTVVDRGPVGEGASFGNASQIATASVVPQSVPGIWGQTLRLLRDPEGPLIARPAYIARNLSWFLRFLANGNAAQAERGTLAMAAMLGKAWDSWRPVVEQVGAQHLVRRSGALHVFRTRAALEASRRGYDTRRSLGIDAVELGIDDAMAHEPALAPTLAGAVHLPGMGYVSDTLGLSQLLAARLRQGGGQVLRADVGSIDNRGITTSLGRLDADQTVLAAGAWSPRFGAALGLRLPVVSERGYHCMLAPGSSPVRMPLLLVERKMAVTPMVQGVRMASVAEFTAPDARADHDRAARVFGQLGDWVQGLDATPVSRWVGPRPSTPDSRPVLGRAPGAPNVLLACGHGHLGLTLAALTGEVIADLARGRTPAIDMEAVSPLRF